MATAKSARRGHACPRNSTETPSSLSTTFTRGTKNMVVRYKVAPAVRPRAALLRSRLDRPARTDHTGCVGPRWVATFLFVGAATVGLLLACSTSFVSYQIPPPPSEAAAPWVGCYVCNTSISGIPVLYVPVDGGLVIDGSTSATFSDSLMVSASANTLTGVVTDLDAGGGCELKATVVSRSTANLYAPSSQPWICDILTNRELIAVQYNGGTFTLDGDSLTGDLAVWFPLPWCYGDLHCDDAGIADAGTGHQVSSCTRLEASTCPVQ